MLNHENFAVAFGRAVEVLRAQPDAIPEQKAQLRALVALTKLGGAVVRLTEDALTVEGTVVPPAFPGIRTLVHQLEGHLVREIRIAQHASAADLLALVRALAVNVGEYAEGDGPRQRISQAASVRILSADADPLAEIGRPVSVTEAFAMGPILAAAGEAPEGPDHAADRIPGLRRDLRDTNRATRFQAVRASGGRVHRPLVPTLLAIVEQGGDQELVEESCRALGRIGTPEALQALIRMVTPGGWFFRRKPAAGRLAAIEGLRVAGTAAAVGTLETLTADRDRDVRRAARAALEAPQAPD